ncbi:MAG TPA: NUDIX hydrolase [Longimicrobium sp.]|nr:NUDIX hydrolase [Longimicrobium sp.]
MQQANGPWEVLGVRRVYENDFIQVDHHEVIQPDGRPGIYGTVTAPPGACVLPLDDDGNVYLVRQARFVLRATSLEAPAGAVEPGEAPLEAARRELREEIGVTAERWTELGMIHLDTSLMYSPVHLFLARGLRFDAPAREGNEAIQSTRFPFAEAVELVMAGEITQAASCVLLLKSQALLAAGG